MRNSFEYEIKVSALTLLWLCRQLLEVILETKPPRILI
jgi:hypothetical protein